MAKGSRIFLAAAIALSGISAARAERAVDSILVSMVPSAFPVGFDLLTQGGRQYLAYFDSDHNMVVASRRVDSAGFTRKVLPSRVAWDSHNGVVLELDDQGHLHVSGNMHNNPLVYFRTTVPGDVNSLVKVPNMVLASKEQAVTYPHFLKTASGDLYFFYRQGASGNGDWYFDKYDSRPEARAWSPLYSGTPLFGSEGDVNAYFQGPELGPDGRYHISYMWRDTPDASTCHDIGYIRTRGANLDAWETVSGTPLALPVTMKDSGAVADPVAVKKGLLNSSNSLGFDSQGRAVISYHKYDAAGLSQLYNARWSESGHRWQVAQASNWKSYTWAFSGGGSIPNEISAGAVEYAAGKLTQAWQHPQFGSGTWILDENTLQPINPLPKLSAAPSAAAPQTHLQWSRGQGNDATVRYAMQWQTLGANRDARPDTIPPDSRLLLVKYAGFKDAVSAPQARARAASASSGRVMGNGIRFTAQAAEAALDFDGLGRRLPLSPLPASGSLRARQ